MRKAIVLTFFLFVSFGVTFIQAQENAGDTTPGVVLHHTESFLVTSSEGYEYRILVSLPINYEIGVLDYPVLYLLDPALAFGTVSEMVNLLAPDQLPELIVVGIDYPNENQRMRDYAEEDDKFLAFIIDELIPIIDAHYRTMIDDRAIVGFSLGGQFVLHTLGSMPGLFNRYILISPAPTDSDEFQAILNGTDEQFRNNMLEHPAKVFVSSGSLEAIAVGERLTEQNYDGLELTTFEVENGTHRSSLHPGLLKGILTVYCGAANEDPITCGRRVRAGE